MGVAFLRARWKYGLDMQQVSAEEALPKTHIPILLIHGQVDGNIPVRHSRRIHLLNPETVGSSACGSLWSDSDCAGGIRDAIAGVVRRQILLSARLEHRDEGGGQFRQFRTFA